jgi:hypothetical protein
MEELLRNYFQKSGYYVIRGVPFVYKGFDVTDIDLWLYSRTSSVSRDIIIVDCKNKKTPQAIERIFWIQGLKNAVNANRAIVATTDNRAEIKDFGRDLDVVILDGDFLKKLIKSDKGENNRISDEEFINKINEYQLNKLDGDWKGRIRYSKSLLSAQLSFDSINKWLPQGKFFAQNFITKENRKEIALRCLYLICSFIAVALDYCMKELSFNEQNDKTKLLNEGFKYGSRGTQGVNEILELAVGLVKQYTKDGELVARQVRMNINEQFKHLATDILAEYFSKNEVSNNLFAIAKEFEQLAMNQSFITHGNASLGLRSMLFCLLDFWNIDRRSFIL